MFMRKKGIIWLLVVFSFTLILAACGEKSQESVLSKLEDKLEAMDGYKAKAEMKMSTGKEERNYAIDIWHKKKDYYRVALSGESDDKSNQVILKNNDGVFVLTPALNKSFKFQTDWPENSSQPYLYQSLVSDIKEDKEATFTATDTHYIFHTKTNYQSNNSLPYQEITFDKKNLTPVLVKVLDKDQEVLVEVKFGSFDMNASTADEDFKVEENMTSDVAELPASSSVQEDSFTILFPVHTAGAELMDKKEVSIENGERVMMTFAGDKSFTLVQEKIVDQPALSAPREVTGDIVHLGFTVGILSEHAIEWSHDGVDFYLASEDLTNEELIEVAASVQGKEVK